jgi:hypothetical protein
VRDAVIPLFVATLIFYLSGLFAMNIKTTCPATTDGRLLIESWIQMNLVIKRGGFEYKNLIEVTSFKIQDLAHIFPFKLKLNMKIYECSKDNYRTNTVSY